MKDLILDLTDLVSRLSHSRIATGIQRVVVAVSGAALEAGASAAKFDARSGTWSILPSGPLQRLLEMSSTGGSLDDTAWIGALDELAAASTPGAVPRFTPASILVSLGAPWDDLHSLQSIRVLRRLHGVRYAAFVHDTVPIDFPEWCENDTPERFREWFYGCLTTADLLIVNSEATAACVERACGEVGFVCPPLVRCRLDAVGSTPSCDVPRPSAAIRPILCGSYVLFVATLEPRKNHLGVVAAWRKLRSVLGKDTPLLVFAGAEGWRAELVTKALGDPRLEGGIVVLTNVTEDDLASLYRNSLFTVYNSLWEGWGLPVTESIAYGKVPVVPAHSGLLESGAGRAEYFPPDDTAAFAQVLVRLLRDRNHLAARTSGLAGTGLRSWTEVARDLAEDLKALLTRSGSPGRPLLEADTLYRFSTPPARQPVLYYRDAAVAEGLRGAGWHRSEKWGTWSSASSFEIIGRWREERGAGGRLPRDLAIYLAVLGHHDDCELRVRTIGGVALGTFEVAAHRETLLRLVWPSSQGRGVALVFDQSRLTDLSLSCDDERVIGVGLISLMIGHDADPAARCRFYESYLDLKGVVTFAS